MAERLRGMFAFGFRDSCHAPPLARDPHGIKPLYYADNGKTFRFARRFGSKGRKKLISLPTPEALQVSL
jgi:asparagine synthetase B (glutamine-hydrolysing)